MDSDVRYSVLKEKIVTNDFRSSLNESSDANLRPIIDEYEMPTSNTSDTNINNNNNSNSTKKDFQVLVQQFDSNDQNNVLINQPSKIKRLTNTEKCLILLIVFLCLIISIYTFIILNRLNHDSNDSKYCMTNQCIMLASTIYKSINKNMNPCEDFYEYACGGWLKANLIPTGFPRWGTLSSITYRNQLVLKEQLELNLSNATQAEQKARDFYRSCIDPQNKIESLGARPLLDILDKFMYKNQTTKQLEVNMSFVDLFSLIQIRYGLNGFFEFDVLDDDKNSSFSNIEVILRI